MRLSITRTLIMSAAAGCASHGAAGDDRRADIVPTQISTEYYHDGTRYVELYPAGEWDVVLATREMPVPPQVAADMYEQFGRHCYARPVDYETAAAIYRAIPGVEHVRRVYYLSRAGRVDSRQSERLSLTQRVLIKPLSGQSIDAILAGRNVESVAPTTFDAGVYGVAFAGNDVIESSVEIFRAGTVEYSVPQFERIMPARLIPNDTFFDYQWHLYNTGQAAGLAGADINVTPAWDSILGRGVTVAVVDDGVELVHPDLAARVVPGASYDFNDGDDDPTPNCIDGHGTSMAGLATATGNNNYGTTGVAPGAGLVGLRLIAEPFTDEQTASALTFAGDIVSIYNNSWGPTDDGRTFAGPGVATRAAFERGVLTGRRGLGSIYVWAAGNGGTNDNVGCDGFAASRYAIAVGATTNLGKSAIYTEPGASVLVNAPSSGGTLSITTTDATGFCGATASDYRTDGIGTSSAAAIVSGVVALMLEANPTLGWRDVQHILIRTAVKNDPTDAGWRTNGAQLHFHQRFGFGRVDAAGAVALASTWVNVGPPQDAHTFQTVNRKITDNNANGINVTIPFPSHALIEHVELEVNILHARRGDLEIRLRSPAGTENTILSRRAYDDDDDIHWTFASLRDWGEESSGDWNLNVRDISPGFSGTLQSCGLHVYGAHIVRPQGDMNLDHETDALDLPDFNLAMRDPAAYAAKYAGVDPYVVGDMNFDGTLNNFDILPFLREINP